MAWVSNETKMDTGQLYVSSDNGVTYTPIDMHSITECKVEIKTTVKNSACKMLEQERAYEMMLNGEWDILPKVLWDAWMCSMEAAVKREMARIPEFKIDPTVYKKLYLQPWGIDKDGLKPSAIVKINTEKENKTMERKPEARKCERCGKLFEVSFDDGYCDVTNAVDVINKTIKLTSWEKDQYNEDGQNRRRTERIRIHNDNSEDLKESRVTLCRECRASLKNWWEHPESDIPEADHEQSR